MAPKLAKSQDNSRL